MNEWFVWAFAIVIALLHVLRARRRHQESQLIKAGQQKAQRDRKKSQPKLV